MIEIYTDGSCLDNPNGPGGWGAVIVKDGQVVEEMSGRDPSTTNNRMEITAVIRGLGRVKPGSEVIVNSDSEYVIKTMTLGWKRKANQDLWPELDAVVADRRVSWNWVRGHDGNEMNETADRLANGAAHGDVVNRVIDGSFADAGPDASQPAPAHLTHINESGEARMVDVGDKDVTDRVAVARGRIVMKPETLRLIRESALEKGDVLGVARTAAVMAAKKTHELIPLCHQIPLTQVVVEFDTSGDDAIEIEATARASWKTGVEMEALTAASIAALTIYDMAKAVDRGMRIESIRVVKKSGGKSGDWEFE